MSDVLGAGRPMGRGNGAEQAVLVRVRLAEEFGGFGERLEIDRLDDELREKVEGYDGYAVGESTCTFYLYGADAERLWTQVQPLVEASPLTDSGGDVLVRYGPP